MPPQGQSAPPAQSPPVPRQSQSQGARSQGSRGQMPSGAGTQRPPPRPISAPGPGEKRPGGLLGGLSGELGRLLGRLSPMNLETDDLILAMILYLMYRESHDEELLYILAAMFLL